MAKCGITVYGKSHEKRNIRTRVLATATYFDQKALITL